MRELTDQEKIRREKAEKIRSLGMDPFGHVFNRTAFAKDIKEKYKDVDHDEFENITDEYTVAGRIMFIRKMGKASQFKIKQTKFKFIFQSTTLVKTLTLYLRVLTLVILLALKVE